MSRRTRISVAIGPRKMLAKNHAKPLRFLLWASPVLISASVPHPTKNSDVGELPDLMAVRPAQLKLTFGALRSVGSSILKSSAGRKPNMPAKITFGKISRALL